MTRTDTLRMPYSNPGQGIVSEMEEPTRVFGTINDQIRSDPIRSDPIRSSNAHTLVFADLGMEKFIHTLGSCHYTCSALYKNVACCYGSGSDGKSGFFFYDIGTAVF